MTKQKLNKPRHSLQPQSSQLPPVSFRHTKSANYDKRQGAKKRSSGPGNTAIPTIHEDEGEATGEVASVQIVDEKRKERKTSRESTKSGYDNKGFQGSTTSLASGSGRQFQRNSTQQSFMSNSSMKDQSVRSLP